MSEAPISVRDEQQLEWFFSRGQTAFERSTTGGMFERAELYSKAREYGIPRVPVFGSKGQVIGWESDLNARPTAEFRSTGGYVPDDMTLIRYALVSATLKRLERQSPQSAMVLELWYGDVGQRWAARAPQVGRDGALFHITKKGRALIAEERKTAAGLLECSDVERIEVLVEIQRKKPRRELGQALAYCALQATKLRLQARAAWHAVRGHA